MEPNTIFREQWMKRIERALAYYEEAPLNIINLRFVPPEHRWLLLNWKSWSLHYAVSVEFILTTLLDYHNKTRYRHNKQDRIDLGVSVLALTGKKAQEILEKEIALQFPGGENRASHRSDLRSRMLQRRLQKFPPEQNLATNLHQYRKTILEYQQRSISSPSMFKRPWRGNPFLDGSDTF